MRHFGVLTAMGFLSLVAGCGDKPVNVSAETALAAVGPQPDIFVDGRRFVWVKKVTYVAQPAERPIDVRPNSAPVTLGSMTPEQLAMGMRPRMLKDGHEYTLAEPDIELARRILADPTAPETAGSEGVKPAAGDIEQTQGAWIVGSDDRSRVGCTRLSWPSSAKAHYSTNCSATMIGLHTAAIAAHCLFNNGWFAVGTFTVAADTADMPACNQAAPFGTLTVSNMVVPGGWNDDEWFYDYAVMEFTTNTTGGFVGTVVPPTSGDFAARTEGYPIDKPYQQFWGQSGTVNCAWHTSGGNICTNTGLFNHAFDIWQGQSGSGFIRVSDTKLFAIQSTQSSQCTFWSCDIWNTARTWTSDVYNFFDTAGNWP